MRQPLVGDELPNLKGVITALSYTSCFHPLEARAVKRKEKSIKGKRHMKKGGKKKVGVTHVPRLLPSTSIHPCVGFPHHNYPCTMVCGLEQCGTKCPPPADPSPEARPIRKRLGSLAGSALRTALRASEAWRFGGASVRFRKSV